jgi:hypothetical protein
MATDEFLLDRMRNILNAKKAVWSEKKMFGGNCFIVADKMLIGTYKGGIMARVEPDDTAKLLKRKGAGQMIHGGREMKGYLFIDAEGYDSDKDLEFWIQECLAFNPKAKSSKKK